MTKLVVTHAVKNVDQWLASHAKTVEFFAPYATDIVFYTMREGSNNVAIALDVHDMEGMMAAVETPKHAVLIEEAGVIHPPHGMYYQAAG